MTTSVKVRATCGKEKEVVVNAGTPGVADHQTYILQDGQEEEYTVYDDLQVTVCERIKPEVEDKISEAHYEEDEDNDAL